MTDAPASRSLSTECYQNAKSDEVPLERRGSQDSDGSATSSYETASDHSGGETVDEGNYAPREGGARRTVQEDAKKLKLLQRSLSTPGYIELHDADAGSAAIASTGSMTSDSYGHQHGHRDSSALAQDFLDKAVLEASGANAMDFDTAQLARAYSLSKASDSRRPSLASANSTRRMSDALLEAYQVIEAHPGAMDAAEEEALIRSIIVNSRKSSGDDQPLGQATESVAPDDDGSKGRTRRPPTQFRFRRQASDTKSTEGATAKPAENSRQFLRRRSSHRLERPEDEFWHVPYFPTIYFTGRDQELAEISRRLTKKSSQLEARCGISQHGGSGKTQLMLRYAWESRAKYPGGIYLIEADNTSRLQQSFLDLAFQLKCTSKQCPPNAPPRVIADAILLALGNLESDYLICVDNADDSEVLEMLGQVYLPPARGLTGSHIMVTSRSADSRLWANTGIDSPMVLGMLPEHDAAVCLFRCGTGKWRESHHEVKLEIEKQGPEEMDSLYALVGSGEDGLDGLPLAIEQAGAYVLRTKRGFADYRRFYRRQMLKLLEKEKAAKTRDDDSDREQRSVATTWGINVQGLPDTVQRLLTTIACFNPHRIPEDLLMRLTHVFSKDSDVPIEDYDTSDEDAVQFNFDEWVIEGLVSKYSILALNNLSSKKTTVKDKTKRRYFSLHRVMRMVVLAKENERGLADAGSKALSALYLLMKSRTYRSVVDANRADRDRMLELSPHARAVIAHLDLLPLTNDASVQLAFIQRAEAYLDQFRGRYPEAIGRFQRALALFRKVYSEHTDQVEIANTLCQLGNVLSSNGDYQAAAMRCENSLDMFERLHPGRDDPGTAQALHRAAVVHSKLQHHAKAKDRFVKSLQMNRRLHGKACDHDDIAATLYRLGNELEAMKQPQDALE